MLFAMYVSKRGKEKKKKDRASGPKTDFNFNHCSLFIVLKRVHDTECSSSKVLSPLGSS